MRICKLHLTIADVTERIARRSRDTRRSYLARLDGFGAPESPCISIPAGGHAALARAVQLAGGVVGDHNPDGTLIIGTRDATSPELLAGPLRAGRLACVLLPEAQMPSGILTEALGVQLPGAGVAPAGSPLADALGAAAAARVVELARSRVAIGRVVDEKAVVNAVVALIASGGSTNHAGDLVEIAAAAGLRLTWDDFRELSAVVPLLARVPSDVAAFHRAGGTSALFPMLLDAGLMHERVETVAGPGLHHYCVAPTFDDDGVRWVTPLPARGAAALIADPSVPFAATGGVQTVGGSLGRGLVTASQVKRRHRQVEAPARVYEREGDFLSDVGRGAIDEDVVVVIRYQGPKANGMPELQALTPALDALQSRGHRVALVTDGRASGAAGTVPAAVGCVPEAADGGPLARVRDGDRIRLDVEHGRLDAVGVDLEARTPAVELRGVLRDSVRELSRSREQADDAVRVEHVVEHHVRGADDPCHVA